LIFSYFLHPSIKVIIVQNISLTVLVPFYSEENTITESLKNLIDSNVADEIILINDCSSDNSLKKLNNLIKKIKIFKLSIMTKIMERVFVSKMRLNLSIVITL